MKLKEKFYNLYEIVKISIKKFPVTIITIFILSLIYAICVGNSKVDWNVIERITLFSAIFIASTFLIETLLENNKKSKVLYYILSVIWSALLTLLFSNKSSILGLDSIILEHYVTRIIVCFVISAVILSIYFNYKKSQKEFAKYLIGVFVSIFKASFIYCILAIGIAIVTSIFIFLILNGRSYILVGKIEILLLGLYYLPAIIYAFYNQDSQIGKFAKIVIKYVLGTLVMIAFVIIYIYLLKILILRNIPSNQIFRILAALFIVGLPIWTMCDGLDEGKTFDKINRKLPLLFAPFIFLQIYSITVRIAENGMTEARYLCLMLIAFEIIYTLIYIKNKSKIGINLLVIVALSIISIIMPFVNMFKVSALNQYSILRKYDEKENISAEEKAKLYGAYYYLEDSVVGKKYIENYELKNKDVGDLKPYESDLNNYEEFLNANSSLEYVSVGGYKRLYNVNSSIYNLSSLSGYDLKGEENTIDKIFEKVTFKTNDKDIAIVNMTNLVKEFIKNKDSIDEDFKYMNEIIVDENRKIILRSMNISYNKMTNEVSSYNFIGYLLEK